jgi:hypothetical protein
LFQTYQKFLEEGWGNLFETLWKIPFCIDQLLRWKNILGFENWLKSLKMTRESKKNKKNKKYHKKGE